MLRLALLGVLTLFAPIGVAPCNAASPLPASAVRAINASFADFNRPDTPGYAIGVVDHGELIFAEGYGEANLDDRVPITRKTVFHLASLSKQFTAGRAGFEVHP